MPLMVAAAAVAAAVALAACTGSTESPAPTVPPTGAIATPVVGGPPGVSPSASTTATVAPTESMPPGPAGTTSTDFGAIRDAVPPSFPLPPDLQPTDVPDGAWSGTYSTPTSSGAVASAILAGLEDAGWSSVTVSDPTEAGEVTIDATGAAAGCRTRVTVGPMGGLTVVKVLYGAACPTE